MAIQTVKINYTVAASANGRQPEVDVHLVLTYDDAAKRSALETRQGAFTVTSASGTYTIDGTAHDIVDLKQKHTLGNDDNWYYPGQDPFVDRHGITFRYSDPLKGSSKAAQAHTKAVNLFFDPRPSQSGLKQYSDFKSREITLTDSTPRMSVAVKEAEAPQPFCFAEGTSIRTARGDVAVEALRVGDLAVTASGALRPIRWLGRRALDLRQAIRRAEMGPVCIAAHAFGPGIPARDLFLSPGHPVLVGADADHEGGHLVPIMCLVNGTTVRRVAVETVIYWHVELDGHDILMAEGLPAESYIECGDRAFFARGDDGLLTSPDLVVPGFAGRCRPVAIEGAIVEAERDRLDGVFAARLARASAWPGVEVGSEL